MRAGQPGNWRLELGQDAAREVREAPPVIRAQLVTVLNELEAEGLPAGAESLGGPRYRVTQGEVEALVVVEAEARLLVVARLTARGRPPIRDALGAAGVPPVTASRVARHLDELAADVRVALRSFRRSPGFVLSVVATLAIALGGATTFFGLANGVFGGALPFEDDHELLRLRDRRVTADGEARIFNMSPLNAATVREQTTTLDGVVAASGSNHVLTGGEAAERVNVIRVSEGWADLLGVRPRVGRVFSAEEERLGGDAQVALLSHALWERRFGADPGMVGRRVEYDGGVFTVVGVLSPRFRYPYDADIWMPWRWDPTDGVSHDLNVVARMADGVTVDEVHADLDRIAASLREIRADTNADLHLNAESLRSDFIRDEDQVLLALLAAVGFLLLLACVNVTNLFVARFVGRQREVGIRVALGAGRIREIRGFVVESVLLFAGGGLAGIGLALWLGSVLEVLVPDVMRSQLDMGGIHLTGGLVLFGLSLSIGAGIVFGAVAAARGTGTDVVRVLKDGGRGGSARGGAVQRGLVVTQLALSLSLLVGAGVLFGHFNRLRDADLGMDIEGLFTLRVSLEQERFATPDARLDIVERLTGAVAATRGVEAVGYTTVNPLCCGDWGAPLAVEGRIQPEGATSLIHHRMVGPGYFDATGTQLLAGRDFDRRDAVGTVPTVIVDKALADRYWPGDQAVGKRVRLDRPDAEWRTIVGVVADVDEEGDYNETWYLPYTQDPTLRSSENLHFMIRAADPAAQDRARRAVRGLDPTLAVYGLRTMASLRSDNISQDRLGAGVGLAFAAFGLLLAGLGVFGMLSYSVSTRAREIGTRIALGAHPFQVTRMVLRRAIQVTGIGAVFGLALSFGLTRILTATVFGVEPAGPLLVVGLTTVLLAVALLGAAVPAFRASRVDPLEALSE
jgi:predicted permease